MGDDRLTDDETVLRDLVPCLQVAGQTDVRDEAQWDSWNKTAGADGWENAQTEAAIKVDAGAWAGAISASDRPAGMPDSSAAAAEVGNGWNASVAAGGPDPTDYLR